jgi:hypothetical protein
MLCNLKICKVIGADRIAIRENGDRDCHHRKAIFWRNFKARLLKMVKKKRKMVFIISHIISIITIVGLNSKAQLV